MCRGWLAAATLLLWPLSAFGHDGALQWQTLATPQADIHFPKGYEQFARRVADTLADAVLAVGPVFNRRDHPKLQLTIDDYSDDANGYAQALPYDHVHVQAYPPSPSDDLGDHGDWIRALVFHEFSHILHLGDVSGPPAKLNAVLGRTFMPNSALPRLVTEGIATWLETRHTGGDIAVAGHGGRIGSPQFNALLRAAVRDGTLPKSLNELTGYPLNWPRGNGWYLYGSLLVDELVARHGEAKLRLFMAEFGKQLIPYGLNGMARRAFGESLEQAWQRARARAIAEAHEAWRNNAVALGLPADASIAAIEAAGDGERLTFDGGWRGRVRPIPGQDAAVVAHAPNDGVRWIQKVDLATGAVVDWHRCALDCDEPIVSEDGKWLIYTESRPYKRLYSYREIVVAPIANGKVGPARAITSGLRGRAISLESFDDRHLFGVTVKEGRTGFFELDWKQLAEDPSKLADRAGDWHWVPWAPDPDVGGCVVSPRDDDDDYENFRRWMPLGGVLDSPVAGFGDFLYTKSAGAKRIAADLGGWQTPRSAPVVARWVGDLQWVMTSSKKRDPQPAGLAEFGGVRQAAFLGPAAYLRTSTVTGIASAAHFFDRALTVRYGGHGLDIWRTAARKFAALHPEPGAASLPYAPTATAPEQTSYNPLPSLRPRAWRPILTFNEDLWLGAQFSGRDAVGWLDADFFGQWRSDGGDPLITLDLALNKFEPTWTLSAAFDHSSAFFRRGFNWYATPVGRMGVRLGGAWQVPGLRQAWSVAAGVRVRDVWLRERQYDLAVAQDPAGPPPVNPAVGLDLLGDAALAWRYAERYAESFRAEKVHAASLSATVGRRISDGKARAIFGAATDHAWPLGSHYVASVAANLAIAPVPGQSDPLYAITGIHPLQALAVLGLGGPSSYAVRGAAWDGTGLGGNGLGWGTVAWHFPVAAVGRSLDTLPIWLGRVYGSVFADAAVAFWPAGKLKAGALASLGAELATDLTFGYAIDATLHLGWAQVSDGRSAGWLSLGF